MKRCFHTNKFSPVSALILCLAFSYSCMRSGPDNRIDFIIPAQIDTDNNAGLIINRVVPDKEYLSDAIEGPEAGKNLIIPGRIVRTAEFLPGTEASLSLEGVLLTVPAGGMKRSERLSVTGLLADDLPPIPAEITNVTKSYYAGYRFLPHGTLFDLPAVIAMAYDKSLIPEGYSDEDIYTWYFDESDMKWKALERDSVNYSLGLIISATLHFTDMINGIIKVPESPGTDGFAPTSITDIKAADPAAGITLINPPVGNNIGDAELSYSFKLPEGRSGIQPRLSLKYSSDGSSGWTGLGWGLNVAGISVDISWGVPRYLPDKESETYLFAGTQLTPVAHRGEYIDRTPEKRFYQRVEGSFSKIIRHGDNPSNYWWEVTSKEGVRNFYGGSPSTGTIANAVSLDSKGNIGYWALTETRDLHDNFVSYMYDKPSDCGQQIYISEISYTGFALDKGPYKITFLRNNESDVFVRRDARITAGYGFIQRDRELLRRIQITYNDQIIRSYNLHFNYGNFSKTLLESITELDAAGKEFYTHSFAYYDDIHVRNQLNPFGKEEIWSLPDDNLKDPLLNPVNLFFDNVTALGGSGSSGVSGGVAATVGLLDGKPFLKSMTGGGNVSYHSSESEGFLTLIDLNGDGLPDKVYKKENKIYYRPNLLAYPSIKMFGDARQIAGIENFSISKTSGYSWGVEAHPGIFLGYNNVISKTNNSVYFGDFNADGLVDIVDNGVVYFNQIDENDDPVFTASSENTPNPLYANSQIDMSLLPDPAEEQALLEQQFPLHDAVRMWQAQYRGNISINAPVYLINDTSAIARDDDMKDGVIVSIQHNGSVLWSTAIDEEDFNVKVPVANSIEVYKGDRIYFRVQSGFNGSYDKVYWDPGIIYNSINGSGTLATLEDSNSKIAGIYKASEDFILSGQQAIGMPKTGSVLLRTTFTKPVTSDSLRLEIIHTDTSGVQTRIAHRAYNPSQSVLNDQINLNLEVNREEFIQFRILSNTNIDWSMIRWNINAEYTRIDDGTPVTGNDGKPLLSFSSVPEFSVMYNNPVKTVFPVLADTAFMLSLGLDTIDNLPHPMKISPYLVFNNTAGPNLNDYNILSVKLPDRIIGEKHYRYNGSNFSDADTLVADVSFGDTLYFEYHFTNFRLAESNIRAEIIIGADSLNRKEVSVLSTNRPQDEIFGQLYRGWGQFDYNGNDERADSPIDESLLKLSDLKNENIGSIQDTSDLNGVQNPLGEVFNIMIPYAAKNSYMGTDEQVFVLPEYISSSRLGEKDIYVKPLIFSASGLNALTKVTKSNSNSVSAGVSIAAGSHSWEEGNMVTDMMDMNGDRYPDLLTTDNIQYTGVTGVLGGGAINHSLGDHHSESEATGVTLGGSFVVAQSNNSGAKIPSKNTKTRIGDNSKTDKNAKSAQETAKSSIGLTGSFSSNNDFTDQTWLDINGDGLPDKIYRDGTVMLNLGYSYAPAEHWNFDAICVGKSQDFGGGLGVDIKDGSIKAGVGISKTENEAIETFMDINSDGLPDMVKGDNVYFNTGSGFDQAVKWTGLGALDAGESFGESANAGFTIGIAIPIFMIKICINPSGSVTRGISSSLTHLADINGDGMPDFLFSDKEGEMAVRPSNIFRTNVLKTVVLPLGSSFELDYLLTPAVYDHPGGKLAMKSVKVFDGLSGDGIDTTYTSFEYNEGFYDRHERQFYGFASVKTHFHDTGKGNNIYRTLEQQFSNADYYKKGSLLSETLTDINGRNQKGMQNIYSLRNIETGELLPESVAKSNRLSLFVALDETRNYNYNGAAQPLITTRITYSYDMLGNISGYTDYSAGNENDIYSVAIKYHSNASNYLYSVPSLQEVTTAEGLRRKNETSVNEYGKITRIRKSISGNQTAIYDMEYDEFGNLIKLTRPANYLGERLWYGYEYDTAVHSFVTKVTDAYGYHSSTVYDYRWGLPVEITDKNNNKTQYKIDDCGRVTTLTGPYELASGKPYTIAFEYHPEADVPYARTLHFDSVYNSNIETYSFTDGLGRPVQVKKTAFLYNDPGSEDTPGYIASGKVKYDAFSRPVETFQPLFETDSEPETYNNLSDNVPPSIISYDVLDRILQIKLPDGSSTTHSYSIGDYNGEIMHIDSLTDALNHVSVSYTKATGRAAATVKKSEAGDITTGFRYNALGELIRVTDPLGNQTVAIYDMVGNRTSVNQPDAGLTEFTFDGAGNMTKRITANLRKQIPADGAIIYKYDYERLIEIVYPRNIQNRVNYTYGTPDAPFNRAGRVVLVQDASGGQEFFYSSLGQVVKTIRTVQMGESDMRTWIWSAVYDTWNRVHTMTYPDGEKVYYSYNRAGNLDKLSGEKLGRSYSYISRTGYNKFEKQVYQQFGNGSVTTYRYEPERQRLIQMSVSSNERMLMNNAYVYDPLSNILGITNKSVTTETIGGETTHVYSYDELYQLKNASGIFRGSKDTASYTLGMQYDIMGKIKLKTQTHNRNSREQSGTSYDFMYKYEGRQPGVATEIGERLFTYDENGNMTSWQDTVNHDFRQISWDEENRMTLISDNGYLNRYVYDATGERVIKSHGGTQGVYINGAPIGVVNHSANNYTVYVSPYFVFQNDRFTKHYFTDAKRIASKIGNGQFQNQHRMSSFEITAGKVDYINRQQQLKKSVEEYEAASGLPPGPPTLKGIYSDPAFSGTGYPDPGTIDNTSPRGWPKRPVFASPGGPPGAPVQWSDDITNENVEAGFGFIGNGNIEEVLRYFYHSDHLGSASFITNALGEATQFIAYMPFGETLAEQHTDWESPYKFNGKEIDDETGLYYYGARYYDPKLSIWIGVDPLTEKYQGISPFVYCQNNPVIFKDPDGKEIVLVGSREQKLTIIENLQKLTDDKLSYNEATGAVIVKSAGKGEKLKGTELIKRLIRSEKTTEIKVEENMGNRASEGLHGMNSKVYFDPMANPDIKTEDHVTGNVSGKKRPAQIGLGHELIHVDHYNRGDVDRTAEVHWYKKMGNWIKQRIKSEELRTVGSRGVRQGDITENDLRREQSSTRQDKRGGY